MATVKPTQAKSVVNRISPAMPLGWSINPYRGCTHACTYCYARAYQRYLGADPKSFDSVVLAKVNAAQVLAKELSAPRWRQEPIVIGTVVDPYQPAEGTYRITQQILSTLAQYRTPCHLLTKNALIVRDIPQLLALNASAGVRVFISITSLDADLLRAMEPGTPPPAARLRALERLARAGVPVGVIATPLIPHITDSYDSLLALAQSACNAGAQWISASPLRMNSDVPQWFYPFVRSYAPDLLDPIRSLYRGKYVNAAYALAIAQLGAQVRYAVGLPAGPQPFNGRPAVPPAPVPAGTFDAALLAQVSKEVAWRYQVAAPTVVSGPQGSELEYDPCWGDWFNQSVLDAVHARMI